MAKRAEGEKAAGGVTYGVAYDVRAVSGRFVNDMQLYSPPRVAPIIVDRANQLSDQIVLTMNELASRPNRSDRVDN